ncbi:MAG: DciA family protein [Rudaea sp.]
MSGDLVAQFLHFVHAAVVRIGKQQSAGKTSAGDESNKNGSDRRELGAHAPAIKIERRRCSVGFCDDNDVHPARSDHVSTVQPTRHRSSKKGLPPSIGECAPVASLIQRARALDALDRQLRQPLPEPLRRQVRLADISADRLVFLASSSAWASKLRFHQTALLALARQVSGLPANKFAVKVAPLPPVPPEQIRRTTSSKNGISKTTADHLKAAARSVVDPELQAVYLRMASLAEDSSSPRGK